MERYDALADTSHGDEWCAMARRKRATASGSETGRPMQRLDHTGIKRPECQTESEQNNQTEVAR